MMCNNRNNRNKELWIQFKAGNDNAFAELYKLNVDDMLDYGLHFTPLRDQVKDAIQDVFVNLYNKRDNLNVVENVRVYLLVSLKNTIYSFFKKDIQHYQIDTIEPVFTLESSVEELYIGDEQENEQERHIKQMLNLLSPREREAMYYRYTEGLGVEEICVLMKLNNQSVRNLLYRSIAKIREVYKDYNKIGNKGFL
ncbi:RNA polymerase sigma factor [Bacteroides sp. 519]|uniref:RNA polymerase sigma factor n=1 Tax=Bacteroides sp. 519 TaxID=2302937 RepID=UPI001940345D|nr:sigma-70 family RNA polymerase sigma factor [Bacteroides sp. 519]